MRAVVAAVLVLGFLCHGGAAQTVHVVNMVPAALSNETNQDSEPDITVNPNDPDEIVATAFTPNPSGSITTAPVYISQDGGNTWVLNNIVPSANGMTGDITVSFSRANALYAGILRGGSGLDMRILRSASYTGTGTMTELLGRTSEDQPYARAYSPMGGVRRDKDHVYVGHNDFNVAPATASLEQSLDVATAAPPAGLTAIRLERRTPSGQDGPPVRQAIHPDGTVYGAYLQLTAMSADPAGGLALTGNVVVVRDDDWGQGTNPYSDVTDQGDSIAGHIVASGVTPVWNNSHVFGQERLGTPLTIAVDPGDAQTVYVAWSDRPAGVTGNTATLHVRRSTDGGNNWSAADLLTANGAIVPQLAVNIRGDVGFLYQQLTGSGTSQRWGTHLRQSTDGGTTWSDIVLADTPANNPAANFLPYLGDYAGLAAVGRDFYGVFSASNIPNNANFPNGVTYQRNANFTTHTLLDGTGNAVAVSIDPFFFRVENIAADRDLYVRDWTDSATTNDTGLEPSTDPVFYDTSDVWNRRSNSSGGFDANDRPISEDPQTASLGNNFAFARVHRKGTGSAVTATLHFLKSEFGTGSNYQDAGTASNPTLGFSATEQAKTLTSGYQWTLGATSSTHTCLAVETSTPDDAVVPPGLLGRAPGWPGTDLMVIYDNNKAQRNMGVYTISGEKSSATYWAVVHNAATFPRDVVLQIGVEGRPEGLLPRVQVATTHRGESRGKDGSLVLHNMAPGENRWVSVTVPVTAEQKEGERVTVTFHETVGSLPVNGFAIAMERVRPEVAGAESVRLLATNLSRLGCLLGEEKAVAQARRLQPLTERRRLETAEYAEACSAAFGLYRAWVESAVKHETTDSFGLIEKLKGLELALTTRDARRILPAQSNADHAVDAFLTYLDKRDGDVADVAQNMRWQHDLVTRVPALRRVDGADMLAELSEDFDQGYAARRLSVRDYPAFVEKSLPVLRRFNDALALGAQQELTRIEGSLGSPKALQKAHREFLLRLEAAR